jgi:hypothetical protein
MNRVGLPIVGLAGLAVWAALEPASSVTSKKEAGGKPEAVGARGEIQVPAKVNAEAALGATQAKVEAPVLLKIGEGTGGDVYVKLDWHSLSDGSHVPLRWPEGGSRLKVKAGEFRVKRAKFELPRVAVGGGWARWSICEEEDKNCRQGEAAMEVEVKKQPERGQNELCWIVPTLFVATGLILGALGLGAIGLGAGQSLHASLRASIESLGSVDFRWDTAETWLSNATLGATALGALAAIGMQSELYKAYLTPKEFAAWSALYVMALGLAPIVFGMLKRPSAEGMQATAVGAVLAVALNLFGAGGQLYLTYVQMESLGSAGIVAPGGAKGLQLVAPVLALAALFQIYVRFAALHMSTQAVGRAAQGAQRNLML